MLPIVLSVVISTLFSFGLGESILPGAARSIPCSSGSLVILVPHQLPVGTAERWLLL